MGNRVLFGGGRNLDFQTETTTELALNDQIQDHLIEVLHQVILPNKTFNIDRQWSGIMGMGATKQPIIESLSEHVHCAVRLGGMGIAIGSHIGKQLAEHSQT